MKSIFWHEGSKRDFDEFPDAVHDDMGYNLHLLQQGKDPYDWKIIGGLGKGITGVYELRTKDSGNIYRVAYVAKIADVIVVLHCWQKKTQRTSQSDLDIIAKRYRDAVEELK